MNELSLRTWHRRFGMGLALFIFLQAASGFVLNAETLLQSPTLALWANTLHRGGGDFGTVYRALLGLALMTMAVSGSLIFLKVWRRTKKF